MTDHGSDADRERAAMARRALFDEHVASWLPAWLLALEDLSPVAPYRAWRQLVWEALLAERDAVGPPTLLPLHFRLAPPLADPRTGGAEAFARTLLAPAVSGLIITRTTFVRAAHDLNLGLRAGERRFVLQALMGQAPEAVLAWLAGEASRWTILHESARPLHLFAADHWTARAETTAALLRELAG
jgi:hypothetical protein